MDKPIEHIKTFVACLFVGGAFGVLLVIGLDKEIEQNERDLSLISTNYSIKEINNRVNSDSSNY
jgi:hypothetical protein